MLITEKGLALIRQSEGLRRAAYQDDAGVWTIGYGHTHGVKAGDHCTEQQAEQYLLWDVGNAEATVVRFVGHTALLRFPAGAVDALVDYTFNLGVAGWLNKDGTKTGLCRAVVEGRTHDVPAEFRKWVHSAGHVDKGLVTRREAECALWTEAWGLK